MSCCDHFCGIKILESTGLLFLLICAYMPAECHSLSFGDFLNTLGELEGVLATHLCDVNILVGDCNADFDRCSPSTTFTV